MKLRGDRRSEERRKAEEKKEKEKKYKRKEKREHEKNRDEESVGKFFFLLPLTSLRFPRFSFFSAI
jgi:hypothetical protein